MNVVFRIRREYFDQIVAGKKMFEVRRASRYWKIRGRHVVDDRFRRRKSVAVFICGKRVFRRRIRIVAWYASAREALGRRPSAQGRKDLGRGAVYKFYLGRVEK